MRYIANPIYDVVFKFLLEDLTITRDFLSALLQKEVKEVAVRRNEYSNPNKAGVAIFRIDFAAKVRESDGQERVILIELQKAWVETETLRFRQYLGAQYSSTDNMLQDESGKVLDAGYPIVAVYLLGHVLSGLEEPIVYVRRSYLCYDNTLVTAGVPNAFVESLSHDSIIVQIPRLDRRVSNPLMDILLVFDQSRRDRKDAHLLNIDENDYGSTAIQQRILNRLTMAAANPDVRQVMNIEDEVLMALENRDEALAKKDEQLAQQGQQIAQQGQQIAQLVNMLLASGQSISQIAKALGKTDEEISAILA